MGFDTKYGTVTLEHGSVGGDEPVFVLRAQDKFAMGTISDYTLRVHAALQAGDISSEQAHDLLEQVGQVQEAFQAFALENPDQMKFPD